MKYLSTLPTCLFKFIMHYSLYAIVNDRLSVLELAITPDMGHGWASDVALSNIHERSLLTSCFLLYKNTTVSIKTP